MFYYWLSAAGICFILKYGKILSNFRYITSSYFPFLNDLYKCCLCMGFWSGFVIAPALYYNDAWTVSELIFLPFATAALCWYADSIIMLIQAQTNYLTSGTPMSSSSSSGSTPNK